MTPNWSIATPQDGLAITATAAAGGVVTDIRTNGALVRNGDNVMIDNPGPLDVYARAGGPDVQATVNSMRVPANSAQPYYIGDAKFLALVTAAGSQAVTVHLGVGQ